MNCYLRWFFFFFVFFCKKRHASSLLLRSYLQQFSFLFVSLKLKKKKKGKKKEKQAFGCVAVPLSRAKGREAENRTFEKLEPNFTFESVPLRKTINQTKTSILRSFLVERSSRLVVLNLVTALNTGALHTYVGIIGSETEWVFSGWWSKNNASLNVCRTTFSFFHHTRPSLPLCRGWEPSRVFLLFNFVLQRNIHTHICNIFSSVKVLSHRAIGQATWINDAKKC